MWRGGEGIGVVGGGAYNDGMVATATANYLQLVECEGGGICNMIVEGGAA